MADCSSNAVNSDDNALVIAFSVLATAAIVGAVVALALFIKMKRNQKEKYVTSSCNFALNTIEGPAY